MKAKIIGALSLIGLSFNNVEARPYVSGHIGASTPSIDFTERAYPFGYDIGGEMGYSNDNFQAGIRLNTFLKFGDKDQRIQNRDWKADVKRTDKFNLSMVQPEIFLGFGNKVNDSTHFYVGPVLGNLSLKEDLERNSEEVGLFRNRRRDTESRETLTSRSVPYTGIEVNVENALGKNSALVGNVGLRVGEDFSEVSGWVKYKMFLDSQ